MILKGILIVILFLFSPVILLFMPHQGYVCNDEDIFENLNKVMKSQ